MMIKIIRLLISILALGMLIGNGITQDIQYFRIISKSSNKVIDVERGSSEKGTRIVQVTRDNNSESQQWQLVRYGQYIQIVNRKSSLVMDVPNGSKFEGAPIIIFTANPDKKNFNQVWSIQQVDAKHFKIVPLNSNLALTVEDNSKDDNVRIIQARFTSKDNQLWLLESTKPPPKSPGKQNGGKKKT